jgi:small-conductance mechanosensitive channel
MKHCAQFHAGSLQGFCLALVLTLVTASALATTPEADWLKAAQDIITASKNALASFERGSGDADAFDTHIKQLTDIRLQAQKCVDARSDDIENLKKGLEVLGESVTAPGTDTKAPSPEIQQRLAEHETQLTECRDIQLEARDLADQMRAHQQAIRKSYLLERGPRLWDFPLLRLYQPGKLYLGIKAFLLERSQLKDLKPAGWVVLALVSAVALGFGFWWGRRLRRRAGHHTGNDITARLGASLESCLAKRLPAFLMLIAMIGWLAIELPTEPIPPSTGLLLSILTYLAGITCVQVFLSPCAPASHFLALDRNYARALARHLHSLLLLGLVAVLVFYTSIYEAVPREQWFAMRFIYLAVLIANLVWLVSAMHRAPAPFSNNKLRMILIILLLATLITELLGFRNLSIYFLKGLLGTALLVLIVWIATMLLREFFDGVDEGRYHWCRQVRKKLSLQLGEPVPGLIWLRLLVMLTLWLGFAASVVGLWGYSDTIWSWLRETVTEGVEVGTLRIAPLQWAVGIAVFAFLITLVRWFRNEILPALVAKSRYDRGAQEAIVTISGYIGVILAAIIGLSLAGFSFTNLAIIAGALSVGIGFGLQNIVNNFISGIILLFERPIRTGDWIIVGTTEGYVRKISIRSTQIETFDRADVIVPNSELISNQVTNWVLHDPWGRVTVPIGVAYGSDVEKVREILLQIAADHPLVITDGQKVSPPKVLFRGFGDSALNFELRCFIQSIDRRLDTLSDLNFAINRALEAAGISIPFPQRDLHLRSADPSFTFINKPDD